MKEMMHCSSNFRNPFSSVQDIAHGTQPDKHHFPKLQQTELSQIFSVTDGNTYGGQSLWGYKKKCWWVAADRDPQIFGKLLQIYESEKWAGKDPTEQVGHLCSLF